MSSGGFSCSPSGFVFVKGLKTWVAVLPPCPHQNSLPFTLPFHSSHLGLAIALEDGRNPVFHSIGLF